MPDAYILIDPRPIATDAPYTFFLPSQAKVDAIGPGDRVYLDFQAVPRRARGLKVRARFRARGVYPHRPLEPGCAIPACQVSDGTRKFLTAA